MGLQMLILYKRHKTQPVKVLVLIIMRMIAILKEYFERGVYANTKICVTPGEVMEINFNKTGSYEHSYENMYLKRSFSYKGALTSFMR